MRINNLHLTNLAIGQPGDARTPGEVGCPEGPDRTTNDADFHTPSTELARWLELAHQEAEVRPEMLAKVANNLATGVYLTPACADQTASAMIDAID